MVGVRQADVLVNRSSAGSSGTGQSAQSTCILFHNVNSTFTIASKAFLLTVRWGMEYCDEGEIATDIKICRRRQ